MKISFLRLALCASATTLLLPTMATADRYKAKSSVSRPNPHKGAKANKHRPPQTNRPNRPPQANRPNRNGNNIVTGNTVVVNRNVDRGYGNPHYHHDWDDDDDDFGDFFGKAVAVTAGVALTSAVIGEIVEDEPNNCQQQVSNGQVYMFCNGIWYQPVMQGSNVNYQVINPPPGY